MKGASKTMTVISICLCVAGAIALIIGLFMIKFDLMQLSTEKIETNTHNISEDFDNIFLKTYTADVTFLPSENGECKVVCTEDEKLRHSVTVEDNTLKIILIDERKWYDFIGIFSLQKKEVRVYLPDSEYGMLTVDVDTSDVNIPKDLSFKSAKIESDTGDIIFRAGAETILDISTDTGDITAENIYGKDIKIEADTGDVKLSHSKISGEAVIKTDTGNITLTSVNTGKASVESDTGDVRLENVLGDELISVKTSTGNVKFDGADAPSIYAKTSTGDVSGTLLSEKIFFTKSSTGNIKVPHGTTGGICEISTSTGDINIKIK